MAENNKPKNKYRAGNITLTVWENTNTNKEGKEYTTESYTLQRSYTKPDGKWENTQSIRTQDLPKVAMLCNKAYQESTMKKEEGD